MPPVVLEHLNATRIPGGNVVIDWNVTFELDVVYYRLDRHEGDDAPLTIGTKFAHGAHEAYDLTDSSAAINSSYTYKLYEVNDSHEAVFISSVTLDAGASSSSTGGARQRRGRR